MQRKVFLGINPPEYLEMKKDVDLTTSFSNNDILSGEPIPGRLLLSRACFRFGSTTQNSNLKTIFTTCLNFRPLSQRMALLQIMEDRYDRKSIIITAQLPFKAWYEYIGEPTLADAIMDRLTAGAHKIELKGESLRKRKK